MNIESILTKFGITHINTPEALAVNINCPFCRGTTKGLPDYRFLCGIFKPRGNFHCFRCHRKGSLKYLLQSIEGISDDEYDDLFEVEINNDELPVDLIKEKFKRHKYTKESNLLDSVPGELISENTLTEYILLQRFINKRNIQLSTLIKYKCRFCGYVGKYANRLILPVIENNKVVSFQARDLTNKAEKKYDNPKVSVHEYLYKTEFLDDSHVYIVEGVFDAWRMLYNTVAIFGKTLTKTQKRLLRSLGVKKYIFCLDSDASMYTIKEMNELADYVDEVGMVILPKGKDPDDLGRAKVDQLSIRWI